MSELRTFNQAVALVTGAASGIGKAVSEELAARGAEVILADIDDAEAVAGGIRSRGGKATAVRLDVRDFAAFKSVVDRAVGEKGRLDYLFNNAGIAVAAEVQDHTLEAWRKIVDVNLMGVVHGVQAAYPGMIAQGFGHIVNTASTAGLLPSPGITSYTATKHAVVGLSRALRAEGAARGVRVSAVCPGPIRTPIISGGKHGVLLFKLPEAEQRKLIAELFEMLRPLDAGVFARRLLDQVARNRGIIVIPGWWKLMWWLDRLSPALSGWLARKGFEQMQRRLNERIAGMQARR